MLGEQGAAGKVVGGTCRRACVYVYGHGAGDGELHLTRTTAPSPARSVDTMGAAIRDRTRQAEAAVAAVAAREGRDANAWRSVQV